MASRQRRGRDSERLVAEYLRSIGYPDAQAATPYGPGPDVLGVPWSVEVKARNRLDIGAGLRQASDANPEMPPLLIVRPNGLGEAHMGDWWAITNLGYLRRGT